MKGDFRAPPGSNPPSSRARSVAPASGGNRRRGADSSPSLAPTAAPASRVARAESESTNGLENKPPRGPRVARAISIARTIFGGALIISLSLGMALGARKYVKTSPRFRVQEIAVTGVHRLSQEEVANVGQLTRGTNIFSVDLGKTRGFVLTDPWVKDATVSRRLPGTISVTVVEKEPAVLVAAGDTFLYTREGTPIKRLEGQDPSDFPIITGIDANVLTEDREGAQKLIKAALDLAFAYERTGLSARAPIEELHYEKDQALSVVVGKSGTVLALGHEPWKRKLDQAVRVFAELDRRGQKPDTIFLDNEAHPERVVVRMK